MKKLYTLIATLAIFTAANAKTYVVGSGKWSDASVWGGQYIGSVIKADDVVIITGNITMNTSIVVEGTLQVEKGAGMIGMKDLVVAKTGKFVNFGNTVMKRIINEGTISNNLSLEAVMDIDNKGTIDNNNQVVTGNNFNNFGGNAAGANGIYFINNVMNASPASQFGSSTKVFTGNLIETQTAVNHTPVLESDIETATVVLR